MPTTTDNPNAAEAMPSALEERPPMTITDICNILELHTLDRETPPAQVRVTLHHSHECQTRISGVGESFEVAAVRLAEALEHIAPNDVPDDLFDVLEELSEGAQEAFGSELWMRPYRVTVEEVA